LKERPGILLTALPNLISLLRLCLVPLAIWLMLSNHYLGAFWVFIAAGVSDALDGFIASISMCGRPWAAIWIRWRTRRCSPRSM
jgi:phosphatidylserine synthase